MGTWGAALYDDDAACDLRDSLALLCKVPVPGDRLLQLLKEVHGDCDPNDEDGALFWLVAAEQFERRGIECKEVASTALSIIDSGVNLIHAWEKDADEAFLKKRTTALRELAKRLRSPRPLRRRAAPRNPPPLIVNTGEVYAFRTMKQVAWHPYWLPYLYGEFKPDGWGALVVLATGRAFDWLPWVALASLTVKGNRKPTIEEALPSRLIFHSQTRGAGRFIPKLSHARAVAWELLGRVELDSRRVEPQLSRWSVSKAIEYDWTMAYGAFGPKAKKVPKGCKLSSLVKRGAE